MFWDSSIYLRHIINKKSKRVLNRYDATMQDDERYLECAYYLETYAPRALPHFMFRHGRAAEACAMVAGSQGRLSLFITPWVFCCLDLRNKLR